MKKSIHRKALICFYNHNNNRKFLSLNKIILNLVCVLFYTYASHFLYAVDPPEITDWTDYPSSTGGDPQELSTVTGTYVNAVNSIPEVVGEYYGSCEVERQVDVELECENDSNAKVVWFGSVESNEKIKIKIVWGTPSISILTWTQRDSSCVQLIPQGQTKSDAEKEWDDVFKVRILTHENAHHNSCISNCTQKYMQSFFKSDYTVSKPEKGEDSKVEAEGKAKDAVSKKMENEIKQLQKDCFENDGKLAKDVHKNPPEGVGEEIEPPVSFACSCKKCKPKP